jgi:hypothetical protein
MKIKCFLIAVYGIFLFLTSGATKPDSIPENAKVYVLDGENTSFAYGRQIAPNKIAIGLTDEGVYELRGDTAIWLVEHPGRPDEQICSIASDMLTGNKLFLMGIFEEHERIIHDTAGMIEISDPDLSLIFDKAGESTAIIKPNGKIESVSGIPYLYTNGTIDRKLSAFFLLYHYLPRKKTIM